MLLFLTARFSICGPFILLNVRGHGQTPGFMFPSQAHLSVLFFLPTWESKKVSYFLGTPLSSKQKRVSRGAKHERGFCAFPFLSKIRTTHFVTFFPNSCLCSSSSAVQASSVINGLIEQWVKNLFLRRGASQ